MAVNVWRRFEALIRPEAMIVVTITTVHADGTSTATTLDGGVLRLRGADVPAGHRAFAAAGEIRGPAPDLPYYELEV